MPIYLIRFPIGKKIDSCWFIGSNAGEGVNMIEEMGIDVIEAAKVKQELTGKVMKLFPNIIDKQIELQKKRDFKPI